MMRLKPSELAEEAEKCRLQALSYLGTRQASFLLRVAREFDRLAEEEGKESVNDPRALPLERPGTFTRVASFGCTPAERLMTPHFPVSLGLLLMF